MRVLALLLLVGCGASPPPASPTVASPSVGPRAPVEDAGAGRGRPLVSDAAGVPARDAGAPPPTVAPPRLACLTASYPDAVREVVERDGAWFVVFADGRDAPWDDGREKDADARLGDPDLEDTMAQPYPAGATVPSASSPSPVAEGEDPGRARHPVLLDNAYGANERAVRAHLVEVPWPGGGSVRVSERNGAAAALRRVIASFSELPSEDRHCLAPPIGSFAYRVIRGTDRLSGHGYGIAVDLNVACGEYWRWQRPFRGLEGNRMPGSIVAAFEAEGFIWGGRWHHFDTFHFEYRPEFFAPGCGGRAR